MKARIAMVDGATIVGDYDPDGGGRYVCDVRLPGVTFDFVAGVASDDTVTFSPQAPSWLTGALARRLADRVLEARAHAQRCSDDATWIVSARRNLVLMGLVMDSGRRRRGQVVWVAAEFFKPEVSLN